MSRSSPRVKELEIGRRTGLTLPPTSEFIRNDELENPEQLFDAAAIVEESPNASLDGTTGKENDTGSVLADTAAVGATNPKTKVRFSLGDAIDDAQFDSSTTNAIKPRHPVRQLISGKNPSRESIDTMDLSSVSTAPSVASSGKKNFDKEASRQSEETEIAAIVSAAQKHSQGKTTITDSPVVADTHYPDNDDDDDNDEVDDLIPPPPPESPRHDDDEDDAFQSQSNSEIVIDYPNTDGDDDNDGQGFEMHGNDDNEEDNDEQSGDNELPQPKLKRMKDQTGKKISTSMNKGKKKKTIGDSENEDVVKPKRKTNKKINPYSTQFSPKGIPGPRTFTQIPLSDLKPDTPTGSLRRSKRARMPPLEFWRGEKQVLGANDFGEDYDGVKNMPVVVAIAKPEPTPYKKRKVVPTVSNQKKKGGASSRRGDYDTVPNVIAVTEEPFDASGIRKKLSVNDGKVAHLWDERFQEARGIKVVSYVASAKANDLPISKARKKSEGKIVGKAAQSFQMSNEENPAFPGYIVGHLLLPPKGIKDAESVGMCAQVFTIVKGQANSIEVAYGDPDHDSATWDPNHAERFLLSAGDNFLVPPGNSYRIQNHSSTAECLLSWTIIRHNPSLLANED